MAVAKKRKSPFPEFIEIMGTPWEIQIKGDDEDPQFKKYDADGYCSEAEKLIVIEDADSDPSKKDESSFYKLEAMKRTLRHEIVHAFFYESGLGSSSGHYSGAWAQYEEMVDWVAQQGEKIYKTWEKAGCLRLMYPAQYVAWTKFKEKNGT